ncbi:unnamed protein product [Protopolystoma xenopodis]|uniref:Uncharacterized protein n=1 Tax=Protopolystoma xenopodis TaxID=117903 RepID=A0A448WPA1_9PLAT|nr:unnamed protein product [Protopolystoma xenopodis]
MAENHSQALHIPSNPPPRQPQFPTICCIAASRPGFCSISLLPGTRALRADSNRPVGKGEITSLRPDSWPSEGRRWLVDVPKCQSQLPVGVAGVAVAHGVICCCYRNKAERMYGSLIETLAPNLAK